MTNRENQTSKIGLVLSGGGARGAYQAGVLKGVMEILKKAQLKNPFSILTGVSAGAINACFWASTCDNPEQGVRRMCELWENIQSNQVFRTDISSLSGIGLKWMRDFTLGSIHHKKRSHSLLDTAPLRDLLRQVISFEKIRQCIAADQLQALAITASDYTTSENITFVQGKSGLKMWERIRRRSEMSKIDLEHVMASSAIPIFFPAVPVGSRFFGDGSLRNMAPLSPAIHLGAEKLMVVGVRKPPTQSNERQKKNLQPTMARILSVMISSIFFDATDLDIERLNRINQTIRSLDALDKSHATHLNLRPIEFVWIQPTEDIASLATEHAHKLPNIVRYLMSGLGTLEEAGELVSYLLFEPTFCRSLVELGYKDAMRQESEILNFLR